MNQLTEVLIYLGMIAAMSERLMEMLKSTIDLANKIENERWRRVIVHAVTFSASAVAAAIYPPSDVAVLKSIQYHVSIVVVGLLGSTGSGVWHDLLGTVTALKEKQKAAAEMAATDAQK